MKNKLKLLLILLLCIFTLSGCALVDYVTSSVDVSSYKSKAESAAAQENGLFGGVYKALNFFGLRTSSAQYTAEAKSAERIQRSSKRELNAIWAKVKKYLWIPALLLVLFIASVVIAKNKHKFNRVRIKAPNVPGPMPAPIPSPKITLPRQAPEPVKHQQETIKRTDIDFNITEAYFRNFCIEHGTTPEEALVEYGSKQAAIQYLARHEKPSARIKARLGVFEEDLHNEKLKS